MISKIATVAVITSASLLALTTASNAQQLFPRLGGQIAGQLFQQAGQQVVRQAGQQAVQQVGAQFLQQAGQQVVRRAGQQVQGFTQGVLPVIQPSQSSQPGIRTGAFGNAGIFQGQLPVVNANPRLVDPTDSRTDTVTFTPFTGRSQAALHYVAPINRNLVDDRPYVQALSPAFQAQYANQRSGMRQLDAQNRRSGFRVIGLNPTPAVAPAPQPVATVRPLAPAPAPVFVQRPVPVQQQVVYYTQPQVQAIPTQQFVTRPYIAPARVGTFAVQPVQQQVRVVRYPVQVPYGVNPAQYLAQYSAANGQTPVTQWTTQQAVPTAVGTGNTTAFNPIGFNTTGFTGAFNAPNP